MAPTDLKIIESNIYYMLTLSPTDIYEISNYANQAYDWLTTFRDPMPYLGYSALGFFTFVGIKGLTGLIKGGLKKTPFKIENNLKDKI
jgi:hypothetical protein